MKQRLANPTRLTIGVDQAIILYDGVCVLCNGFVQWLLDRDAKAHYHYGTITSDRGHALLDELGITQDTVVLIEGEHVYTYADVALQVGKQLGGIYRIIAHIASICPMQLRDLIYRWVARNRYRWFGKYESCPIPDAALTARLVDV